MPSTQDAFELFKNALVKSTPVLANSILFFLSVWQVYDRRLPKAEDRFRTTIYAMTVTSIVFSVTRAVLSLSGEIKSEGGVIAVSILVVLALGFLATLVKCIAAKAFGPTVVIGTCLLIIYVFVSGDNALGTPDTETTVIMAISAFILMILAYKKQLFTLGMESIAFAIVNAYALVYTLDFLIPYLVDALARHFVIARRIQAEWWGPHLQAGMDHAAEDILNVRNCINAWGCPVKFVLVVGVAAILAYSTFQKNKPDTLTGMELHQHNQTLSSAAEAEQKQLDDQIRS